MLKHRLLSAFIIVAVTIGALYLPSVLKLPILLFVCVVGMWEYHALLGRARVPHYPVTGLVGGCLLITATWISLQYGNRVFNGGVEAGVTALILMGLFLRQFMKPDSERPMEAMAATFFGVMYVAFLLNFIGKLLMAWEVHEGRALFVYLLVVVKFADSGAYFIGCAVGRHKLIPRISPAKTWEGCIGGVLTAVIASQVYLWWTDHALGPVTLSRTEGIVLAVLLAVSGILGDLGESFIKRAADVKDSGRWIHGMGGALDVLDSLLFAAPVLYVFVKCMA